MGFLIVTPLSLNPVIVACLLKAQLYQETTASTLSCGFNDGWINADSLANKNLGDAIPFPRLFCLLVDLG
jgi:hypothetical protein